MPWYKQILAFIQGKRKVKIQVYKFNESNKNNVIYSTYDEFTRTGILYKSGVTKKEYKRLIKRLMRMR